jgi:hypothetical protein
MKRVFRKCEEIMHGTVHFGRVATGVARMSSDGNTDMRGKPTRPEISHHKGGHSGNQYTTVIRMRSGNSENQARS